MPRSRFPDLPKFGVDTDGTVRPDTPDSHDRCQVVRDQIEARLDNDLSAFETVSFDRHVERCADCAVDLRLARQIRSDLGRLNRDQDPERFRCPQHVVDAVYAVARQDLAQAEAAQAVQEHRSIRLRIQEFARSTWHQLRQPRLRPAFAALLLVVAMIAVPTLLERPEARSGSNADGFAAYDSDPATTAAIALTPEDIRRAEEDTRLALAYLGKIGRKVEDKVKSDVLGEVMLAAGRLGVESASTEG